jgi:hypothetical protein
MARTITTQEIKPPVRQGETAVIDFTNPDGSDPSAWTLEVYLSDAVTGGPITLQYTQVTALDDADNTIRVTFGVIDTAEFPTGEVYGELWREDAGSETLLRAFKFTVLDPIREVEIPDLYYPMAGRLRGFGPGRAFPESTGMMVISKHRTYHTGTVRLLKFEFHYSGKTDGTGGDLTIKCGVQAGTSTEQTSAIVPVLFGGEATYVLAPGERIVSDEVALTVEEGEYIWTRARCEHDGTGACRADVVPFDSSTEYSNYQESRNPTYDVPVPDYCHSGTFTPGAPGFGGSAYYWGPVNIFGYTGTRTGVVILGDSIANGVGDTANSCWGFRAFDDVMPCTVIGDPAEFVSMEFHNSNTRSMRIQACAKFKHVIVGLGVNSLGTVALATIQAQCETLWEELYALGVEKVWHTRMTRKTTSTDSFATTANQTPQSGFAAGGDADDFDDWLDTQVTAGAIDGVIDYRNNVMTRQGDSDLVWNVGATTDGIHGTNSSHATMAADAAATVGLDP